MMRRSSMRPSMVPRGLLTGMGGSSHALRLLPPRVAVVLAERGQASRITTAKRNRALVRARQKTPWTPPFPGWKPDPETEVSKHKNIRKKAKQHKVFPDVLPEPFTPYFMLNVEYAPGVVVRKGHFLPPAQLQATPHVSWPSDPSKRWTLVMTTPDDPDLVPDEPVSAPGMVIPLETSGRSREVLHWMVTNIPGNDISQGQTVCDYLPPLPKKNAGGHRYAFLLFEQLDGETTFDLFPSGVTDYAQRKNWNTFRVQEQYGLRPKGLAFFKATWDAVVSAQYSRLNRVEPEGPALPNPYRPRKWLDVTKW